MSQDNQATVAIIGAGLVGSLNAIYFAQRGWKVELFEFRSDMRLNKSSTKGRSINLALSERGLSALRATELGLEELILEASIPMKARMVHLGKEGTQKSQDYSVHGEHINAVDRARLNKILLSVVEKMKGVTIHFEHRLTKSDFDHNVLSFTTDQGVKTYNAHLIVGADGAYSKIRDQMLRQTRMEYYQHYIDTSYCELIMPPASDESGNPRFALDPNHLHIWPRHTFMLIALPNPDKSFTCTLFMPFKMFEDIQTESQLMSFFRENFNDAIPLIGEASLKADYFSNPRGSLITVKVSPHNYKDKSVIIGDAAHAMVPFYGQGMNCGFQDVEELHKILDEHNVLPIVQENTVKNLAQALDKYSEVRVKDAHAICDLALYNYHEMRHAVTSIRFLARKRLEGMIHRFFPRLIIPLYTMVSFTTIPYSAAIQRWNSQTRGMNIFFAVSTVAALGFSTFLGVRQQNIRDLYKKLIKTS